MDLQTILNNNANRKELKYCSLLTDLANDYKQVKFVNLCISCLGKFGISSDLLLKLCIKRGIEKCDVNFIISKLSTIIIRSIYYIFCMKK